MSNSATKDPTGSTNAVYLDPGKRHDFVLVFDVTCGNPNGDPDAANLPRIDPETGYGLVTDVSIKRKVRDYVQIVSGKPPYAIYISNENGYLNKLHREAMDDAKEELKKAAGAKVKEAAEQRQLTELTRRRMCEKYYDVRMFGAVMNTDVKAGLVRGPVQITFGQSVDPVHPMDITITRQIPTTLEEYCKGNESTMGRKYVVAYAAYVVHGFFLPHFAARTGVTKDDLRLFWDALIRASENLVSSSSGERVTRGLYVFTHDNPLGNAHAHELFERFKMYRREGVRVARCIEDYDISLDNRHLPPGVTLTALTGEQYLVEQVRKPESS